MPRDDISHKDAITKDPIMSIETAMGPAEYAELIT
jgi:hypothetical protein